MARSPLWASVKATPEKTLVKSTAIRSMSLRLQGMPWAFPRNREPRAKSAPAAASRSMSTGRSDVQC